MSTDSDLQKTIADTIATEAMRDYGAKLIPQMDQRGEPCELLHGYSNPFATAKVVLDALRYAGVKL